MLNGETREAALGYMAAVVNANMKKAQLQVGFLKATFIYSLSSFIHLRFIQYLPGIVLGSGNTVLTKIEQFPTFLELKFYRVIE